MAEKIAEQVKLALRRNEAALPGDVIQLALPGHSPGLKRELQDIERLYYNRLADERNRYNQVSRLAGMGLATELLIDSFSQNLHMVYVI